MSYKPLACLYTFFHIKINNNIPLKMPLNIACFIAVCQPSDIRRRHNFRPSNSQRHLATEAADRLFMSHPHCAPAYYYSTARHKVARHKKTTKKTFCLSFSTPLRPR
jgi:hypothetical protein